MEVACSSIDLYDPAWCDDPQDVPFAYTPILKARKIRLYVVCKMQGTLFNFLLFYCKSQQDAHVTEFILFVN
jgi:hypothetical protein